MISDNTPYEQSTLFDRLYDEHKDIELRKQKMAEQRDNRELDDCTFHPVT
jgi:hypothetical protein